MAAADFVDAVRAAGRAAFAAAACFFNRACVARSFAVEVLLGADLAAADFAVAFLALDFAAVDFDAARAAGLAAARTDAGRAFEAVGFLALLACWDFRPARAIVALALRVFSVFLTDDIRAHSFLALLQQQGSEILQMQQRTLCRLGIRHSLSIKAQRARARSSNYKSANLGPQANAACSEKPPNAPAKHRVNAIRMIKTGPIYEIKISHGTAKIKDLRANNA
ncbi:MAG: hypothetical protein WDN02_05070 [Methylovirgula sp.]|uniref:hypothetical protein n=1 Tax=Methylovirgula sp. TaxID=1978224 RepID=UPI003075FDF4